MAYRQCQLVNFWVFLNKQQDQMLWFIGKHISRILLRAKNGQKNTGRKIQTVLLGKMVSAEENWWMSIFDDVYLQTDARSVCDDQLTREEVDFLENGPKISKRWQILDLCGGQGRHALSPR